MKRVDLYNKISLWLLIFTISVFVVLIYHLYRPVHVINVTQPYRVLNYNKTVQRGDKLIYEVEYVKYYDYDSTIRRNIVCEDGTVTTLIAKHTNVPVGEYRQIIADVTIPESTSMGICYLEVVLVYEVSPIKNVKYHFVTDEFIVTEKYEKAPITSRTQK